MQSETYLPEKFLAANQILIFALGQKIMFNQLDQGGSTEIAFNHPGYGLNIAQTARAFLDIRFKVVSGFVKFMVAFFLLVFFRFKISPVRPDAAGANQRAHTLE